MRLTVLFAVTVALCLISSPSIQAQGGQCPINGYAGDFPANGVYKGCSESEAKRNANRALVKQCKAIRAAAGEPCEGSCSEDRESKLECILFASSLSYKLVCSPAEVSDCPEGSDPHVCYVFPSQAGGSLFCECTCA